MAFLQAESNTLTAVGDRILPAVWALKDRAVSEGIPIEGASVSTNHMDDGITLCVRHTLVSRWDIDSARSSHEFSHELGRRIQSAMRLFHRMPAAKAICVDRRRLLARGEKARKDKAKPAQAGQ